MSAKGLALSSLFRHRVSLYCGAMPEVLTFAVTSFLIGIWSAAVVVLFLR